MYKFIKKTFSDGSSKIIVKCPICQKDQILKFDKEQTEAFNAGLELVRQGMLIQHAFPFLSSNERELLISGTCSKCWDEMFAQQDDEEE